MKMDKQSLGGYEKFWFKLKNEVFMDYIQAIILGGYHNGKELQVNSELEYLRLVEDKQDTPLYSRFSTVVKVSFKEHKYRKVNTKYRKGYKMLASGDSYCLETEDIGLFIPVESSKQYEESLQKVIQKALNVEWIPKFSEQ